MGCPCGNQYVARNRKIVPRDPITMREFGMKKHSLQKSKNDETPLEKENLKTSVSSELMQHIIDMRKRTRRAKRMHDFPLHVYRPKTNLKIEENLATEANLNKAKAKEGSSIGSDHDAKRKQHKLIGGFISSNVHSR